MKKIVILITIIVSFYGYLQSNSDLIPSFAKQDVSNDQTISNAFKNRENDLQVSGSGVVVHILADDTKGSRHQKFLLRVSTGQTLLISHNIDLAPRINSLRKGDTVNFYGEYEWNSKGGVVHWTHHDPRGKHAGGWLKHNGVTYQ